MYPDTWVHRIYRLHGRSRLSYSNHLPLPIQIGSSSASTVYVTPNGILSLFDGSNRYFNDPLPSSSIPPFTICPFWDDMIIYEGEAQGIFYQITGGGQITFEFLLGHFPEGGVTNPVFHFLVSYSTARPGVFTYTYLQIPDLGASATVGAQYGTSNPTALQYSFTEAKINPGLVLTVDTINNFIGEGSAC
ncbi:MAG: hypothetical protein L6R40_000435 [Gallowayella cf. fulva]|nr:MAG: hypothetical protein L6R40_000435 [Xanthomendoza cf. fulva]